MDTKAIIRDAAFSLFAERKFAEITVQDILDRAKCSRYSFYKYYKDKYELMRLYYTSYVTNLLLEEYDGSNYPEVQTGIFQFILDNRGYFENVKDYQGTDSFWDFLESYAASFFSSVRFLNTCQKQLTEEEKYEMVFVVKGALHVFQKFVEEKEPLLSPAQVSELLCRHYPRDYYILTAGSLTDFRKMIQKSEK